jgi:hypothetical protein
VGETRSSSSIIIITAVIRSCTCCTQRSLQLATRPYRHHPQRRIPSSTYPTYPSRHRTRLLKTLPSRRKRTPSLALPAMSNSSEDPDVWIAQLMNCKPLSEGEVKKLCDKVSRGDVPVVLSRRFASRRKDTRGNPRKGMHCDDPNTQRKGRESGQKGETTNISIWHYNWPVEIHLLSNVYIAFRAGSGTYCDRHQERTKPRTQTTPTCLDAPPHHTSSISLDRRFESSSLRGKISEGFPHIPMLVLVAGS